MLIGILILLTPRRLVGLLRLVAVAALLGLLLLLLGPPLGLEQRLGLTDKAAHAFAFFGVTVALFAIAPHRRRTDLALAALALGILTELAQGLTGRSLSLSDLAWNCVGILAALTPGLVERLRHLVRVSPDQDLTTLSALDRRRSRASGSLTPTIPDGAALGGRTPAAGA